MKPNRRLPWLRIGIFALAMMLLVAACLALLMGSGETTFLVPAAVAVLLFFLLSRTEQSSGFDAHAAEIRKRVDDGSTTMHLSRTGEGTTVNIAPALGQDPATMRASASLEKQETILREIYTQGLAQAKISFRVKIVFASIGASLLLLGIGLAVVNAKSGGDQYASIVAGVAGVVTNLTLGVLFVQSNRARTNMGSQGVLMREESQEDRRLNAARELAGAISDEALRNQVRAMLSKTLLTGSAEQTADAFNRAFDQPPPPPGPVER